MEQDHPSALLAHILTKGWKYAVREGGGNRVSRTEEVSCHMQLLYSLYSRSHPTSLGWRRGSSRETLLWCFYKERGS